jgi:hypothetical protein
MIEKSPEWAKGPKQIHTFQGIKYNPSFRKNTGSQEKVDRT